jgi:hypothetical protein
MRTPAWSILVAAGAAACPTGDQECNGHKGAIDAKPKKIKTQMILSKVVPSTGIFISLACSRSTRMSKVLRPAYLYIKRMPINATTAKADRNRTSFMAAYSLLFDPKFRMKPTESLSFSPSGSVISKYFLVWLPHMPNSRYMGITDIS